MKRPKAPGQSALLLLDVIDVLSKFQIHYAVIGAVAASFYGAIRATMDADAVISLKEMGRDLKPLTTALKKQFTVDYRQGDMEDPIGAVIYIVDRF